MNWRNKAKLCSAFMLGLAFVAAPDANAMRVSEYNKLSSVDKTNYLFDVVNDHLTIVNNKDLELGKKTMGYVFAKSEVNGIPQGVADLISMIQIANKNGSADKADVEFAFRVLLQAEWKSKGLMHNGEPAKTGMFFPKGYQVAFKPADKSDKSSSPNPPAAK